MAISIKILPDDPRKKYPLWDADELQKDIERAKNSIKIFQDEITKQQALIEERNKMLAVCAERDQAIKAYDRIDK